MKGRFVTFEGGEGAGKSTQMRLAAARLIERGLPCRITREPGGSEGAETIRAMILSTTSGWDMRTEALLFAAARADHVRRVVEPAVERGEWVLCDRYVDSSRAYQGVGGELGDEHVMALHRLGAGLMPDRTILLDVDQRVGAARANVRDGGVDDGIGGRTTEYHRRVNAAFRSFARDEPERFRVVDAGRSAERVSLDVMRALEEMIEA